MSWEGPHTLSAMQSAELDEETLGKAKMLRRMQILEARGSTFATRPLQSLPVIGGDGSFFQYRAAAMSVMELVRGRHLHALHPGWNLQCKAMRCSLYCTFLCAGYHA